MKLIQKVLIRSSTFILSLTLPVAAYADTKYCGDGMICNPLGNNAVNNIPDFIQKVLQGVLKIGIPFIALAIIYSGFLFVAARGKSEELKKAKDALMYTIIGAAILLGAWSLSILIFETIKTLN